MGKDFWEDKWLKDQYNQRNPGQANHPDSAHRSHNITPPPRTPTRSKSAPPAPGKKK